MIVLAPHADASGVGIHADRLITALRPHVDIVQLRHGTGADDSIGQIKDLRRRLRSALIEAPPGTVVHAEVTGGESHAFWAVRGVSVRRTVTIHDAPRPFWLPFLSRGIARRRLVRAGLLRALSPLNLRLERRWMEDVDVIAMSGPGAEAIRDLGLGRSVVESRLLLPTKPPIPPVWERPAAVGLFGHVYRGKGFDLVPALRKLLPDEVTLRVAGRGTESISEVPGVEVAGAVEGDAEDAWFASVRVVLLPYFRAPIGGIAALAASAVHAEAAAYETPCLALPWPTMDELAAEGGCEVLPDVERLAERAAVLALNDAEVRVAHDRLRRHLAARTAEASIQPYLRLWDR